MARYGLLMLCNSSSYYIRERIEKFLLERIKRLFPSFLKIANDSLLY